MEYIFYITILIILGFSGYQIFQIRRSGTITETGWQEIRVIAYNTIERVIQLYDVRKDKESFINFTITTIHEEILMSNYLADADKNFWTEDKLTAIFRPVINGIIAGKEIN